MIAHAARTLPTPTQVERSKSGRAKCKKCKEPINNGELRIAKSFEDEKGNMAGSGHVVTQ